MTTPDRSDLLARLENLESRLRELEDVREINEVFRRWHYSCTGGFNGIESHRTLEGVDLLTDDGTIEVQGLHEPGTGPHGREELLAYQKPYHGSDGLLPRVFQTGTDYGVTVTGDTATQETNLIILTGYKTGAAAFSMSRYHNQFERTAEGWKIKRIQLEQGFTVPLDDLQTAKEYFASMPQ